ncbi:LacI family transcriptional regulator [Cryobacterium sp. MP_M5]|uniref:LacI family DNA-binding transcriptional regulator n=1 Tax=unclassified Cryobacterium TaxID=2649013 RepID=UPI001A189D18|nr:MULTISPECIES: LacI family DNA-binding transcriptional regulator [unclassified Cryobacterium]MBG6059659.1 LacI family transcriptional regulator [Cryobacterium sp. MP_M3]MEC5176999.1 LacI family transcriptional regulator [Cryobacterium sp. MP_M5]
MKAATVYDVAAHAGVSIATVSRVLRRPADVRASTRERVLASVQFLGYVPSASARGLAARRTGVLGLFFPSIDDEDDSTEVPFVQDTSVRIVVDIPDSGEVRPPNLYFDEVLRGSEREAWRHGFALMVGVGRGTNPAEMVNDIAGRVDGMAVLARSVPDDLLDHVSRRIPVVLIAGPRRGDDYDHVSVSNTEGMQALTEHLLVTHRITEPVYVAGPADSPDDAERYAGFVQALAAAGIDATALPVLRGDFSRIRARDLAEELLAAGSLPRALVCGNDQMALGFLDVFGPAGVRVPEDVIVTGFDGIEAGRLSTPRLTTVHQPMADLGRAAMRAMLSRLQHPDQPPITSRLPVKVLLRESSEGPV